MRIAHFLVGRCNPDSANGVDKTVYYLSKAQAASGNDVALFTLTDKPLIPIQGVMVKKYSSVGFPFYLPKLLLTDLLEWEPDITHLHSVYTLPNMVLARSLHDRRIPYVVTPNGGLSPYVLRRRWYLKIPYKLFFEQPTLNRASFVHAVADARDIKNYGVRVPIITAPNGLDLSEIPADLNRELLAARFPQVRGKRIFLFLGRLDPYHKGLDLLLAGFSQAQIKHAILVLVGPEWRGEQRTLEALARRLNIESQVVFAGPAYGNEKFHLMAGADVFVHTSRYEGVPFSVLEAAALALPCLVTPAADPLRMFSRYKAGILVNPNAPDIAEGVRRFTATSSTNLQIMGAKARRIIAAEFNWAKIAQVLTDAYINHAP